MAMILDLPDAVVARLEREAALRGVAPEDLVAETLGNAFPGRGDTTEVQRRAADDFFGCGDSGDAAWTSKDIHDLRSELATRKLAEGA